MTSYGKKPCQINLVYENLENVGCDGPIFILFVISIFPPITVGLLLFF